MKKTQKALSNLKMVLAVTLLLSVAFTPNSAKADDAHHMVYEVYAGGIHAVQAKVDLNFGDAKGRYEAFMGAKTRGFLGSLVPWHGTFESNGWVEKDGSYSPELHKSVATWRGEEETKDYNYNRNGTFDGLIITEHEKAPEKKDVPSEVTDGTIDALTAAMEVMNKVAAGEECNGSSEVFDGKRRFEQIFVHEDFEDLTPSKYNIFEGKAAVCVVEIKPINGEWSSKPRGWLSIQEQGRDRGTMPTVWMGVIEDGAGNTVSIPVKVRVKTQYGALFMHLAEYRHGDNILIAEKRVTEED